MNRKFRFILFLVTLNIHMFISFKFSRECGVVHIGIFVFLEDLSSVFNQYYRSWQVPCMSQVIFRL